MKTIETKLFAFDELSEDAKKKVLENDRYRNVEYGLEWWYWAYEDFKQILEILGFTQNNVGSSDIYFSGFWSQGDGACFYNYSWSYGKGMAKAMREYATRDKDLNRIAKDLQEIARRSFYQISFTVDKVYGGGNYSHENTVTGNLPSWSEYQSENAYDLEEAFTEVVRDLCRWLYASLEREHDYLTSDECLLEQLSGDTSEEYTEEGERFL